MSTVGKPKVKVKKAMRRRGITYEAVAHKAGVSWFMVWAVVNGRKTSARVMKIIDDLLGRAA